MGKGSRPAKAKNLVLVPGGPTALDEPPATLVLVDEPSVAEPAHRGATSAPVEPPLAVVEPTPAPPVAEPTLAELLELKERIRKEHPEWYPKFRDTFGHQFNEQLVGQLANLTAAELGLSDGADPDRRSRKIRALAPMSKPPEIPYREPEAWVPSGGFGEFRTPEEQAEDARLAAEWEAENAEDEASDEEPEEHDQES